MSIEVVPYDAPGAVCEATDHYLERAPQLNNLIRTLLAARNVEPQPGRYWVAFDGAQVAGLSLQTPFDRPILLSAMLPAASAAIARAIAAQRRELPGVLGEAQLAARFAGEWTEQRGVGAHPVGGQRLYAADSISEGREVAGTMEQADVANETLVHEWMTTFSKELGEPVLPSELLRRRILAGDIWTWSHGKAKAMAATTAPLFATSRLQAVYTPPEHRRKGYAEGLVRTLTRRMLANGVRPILYAELANPTANGIYRRVGYKAIAEIVRYRFDMDGEAKS